MQFFNLLVAASHVQFKLINLGAKLLVGDVVILAHVLGPVVVGLEIFNHSRVRIFNNFFFLVIILVIILVIYNRPIFWVDDSTIFWVNRFQILG